ncbi:DUF4347 domain-containing protein, partial [bacterium AH-315-M10]|nr:DUF4347 domain-containing protein [bacterium AH-315-M10]
MRLRILTLEDRIVLDATQPVDAAEPQDPEATALDNSGLEPLPAQSVEIVFIDGAVADARALADAAPEGSEVYFLDADRSGVEQISEILNGRSGIGAIHILSHGGSGFTQIGTDLITAETLQNHANDLASWGSALTETGDILLYGCLVANTANGEALIAGIAQLSSADVAGSTDLTGGDTAGGDWILEAQTGSIEASALSLTSYAGTLVAPSTPDLAAGSDTGSSSTDNITSDTTPTFSGTADPSVTVELKEGGVVLGSTTSDGTGAWSITSSALSDGAHSIHAFASALSSATIAVTIDTSAAAPSTPDLDAGSDSGSSTTDDVTSDNTPTFSGTTEAGASVELFSDGVSKGTTTADGAGAWSLTSSTLADGAQTITAIATDTAGNVSAASSGLSLTVDTSDPAKPAKPDLVAGSDTGSSSTDEITSDTTPTFTGTAEAGATVELFSDGVSKGTATASGGGDWTLTSSALTDGTHAITVTATDAAGNVSDLSGSLSVTIDTAAPAAPSEPDLDGPSDTGASDTDNITGDTTPKFKGTAEAGSTLEIFSDGVSKGSTTFGGGSWSLTTTALTEGVHSITATATDAAGNVSAVSSGLSVTIDTGAPAAPSTPDMSAGSDSGSSSTDNITSDTTPTFTGTAEASTTVEVFSDGVSKGTTTADGGGAWTLTTTALTDGAQTITATATDSGGNVSALSAGLSVTIDSAAPAAPSTPDMAAGSDSGSSSTDNITSDTTPTFSGTAEAGATVEVFSDGVSKGTTTADGGGAWTLTTTALTDGAHSITTTATDAAGNVSVASAGLSVTIDTGAPAAPSTPNLNAGSDSGSSSTDEITSDTTPTFSGTAEAGATVEVFSDGVSKGTTTADGGGAWTLTTTALTDGAHTITATATDTAGNVSALSGGLSVTIDSAAPAAPSTPDLNA